MVYTEDKNSFSILLEGMKPCIFNGDG